MTGKDLKEKYPLLFSNNPMEPIFIFGLEIEDGWLPLIDILCNRMYAKIRAFDTSFYQKSLLEDGIDEAKKEYLKNKINTIQKEYKKYIKNMPVFTQIKEKFGTLRIYTSQLDPYIEGMIEMAEDMSEHICEKCGNKGRLYNINWHKTLCDTHADERYGDKARIFRETN